MFGRNIDKEYNYIIHARPVLSVQSWGGLLDWLAEKFDKYRLY